ncbi:PepSY domain-containing protein [Devosia chinhatensis]|uniref:PepSY domain-containing protein n=1 Tax=Devosia chinhatensis TaxID=429727 RepID=A0A0F5FGP5_9HYPH|nr:PepSY domain-containing protein [Devosia chinhatensis]KKB08049.1 hypothetical protein VE26_15835 [Devosia chinhatensis]
MKRLIVMPVLALALMLTAPMPAWAQAPAEESAQDALLPITGAMAAVTARFDGQIVAAELQPGRPEDMTDIVYAFRLLTARGDILALRVDAMSGQILEVDGRGLVDARRRQN